MTEGVEGRSLVLDTSVAVKFYVPEEGKEKAERLLASSTAGEVELLAPATLMPEGCNAAWQQHRRGEMSLGEVRETWARFDRVPAVLYAPEDLMSRAGEITADDKLLRRLEGTNFASLAIHLASVERVL